MNILILKRNERVWFDEAHGSEILECIEHGQRRYFEQEFSGLRWNSINPPSRFRRMVRRRVPFDHDNYVAMSQHPLAGVV